MRFHSLPGSKRYAETETEYRTILHRYNTVLTDMFVGQEVYVTTVTYVMDEGITDLTPFDAHALNTDLRRIYHPYDGGADVIMANADERDQLKAAHADWLPRNKHGR